MSRTLKFAAYGAAALLAAFELWVVWLMLHPAVPADYRAYYIDHSTTCLNQPVSGAYALGTTVSFLPDGRAAAKPIRVCGWEGPAGDGTHAVGTSARLRLVTGSSRRPLELRLGLAAIKKAGEVQPQRVEVGRGDAERGTGLVPERQSAGTQPHTQREEEQPEVQVHVPITPGAGRGRRSRWRNRTTTFPSGRALSVPPSNRGTASRPVSCRHARSQTSRSVRSASAPWA